jgi:hypothetical protein
MFYVGLTQQLSRQSTFSIAAARSIGDAIFVPHGSLSLNDESQPWRRVSVQRIR